MQPTVLKLGGELLDNGGSLRAMAAAIAELSHGEPLVVVHGGGRSIDAELRSRGETPRFVDGLRVTDEKALAFVIAVLAGQANTALVAAVGTAGGRAVGLTGADGRIGLCRRAPLLRSVSGELVDLGLVGEPEQPDVSLLLDLLRTGWTPVVCSIGVDPAGTLLNVNADVMAAHLAVALRARRLLIAGTTAGVLDEGGQTIERLDPDRINALAERGAAHSGMLAKLRACVRALAAGVEDVRIVSGPTFASAAGPTGTRVMEKDLREATLS